ncbi:MAG: MliC family protein, partial [Syntrophales bacterium]|nr:MliC family protein [Syntrophales bacterium]
MVKGKALYLLAFFLLSLPAYGADLPCGGPGTHQTAAVYVSPAGAELKACFDQAERSVTVLPPDGTPIKLPLAVSASGARYSNNEATFWEHQGTGRYFKGERLLFAGQLKTAGYGAGVSSTTVLKTGTTSSGQPIKYPATD